MGKLRKTIFTNYAEFECNRKLFLTLSSDNENWREPDREIEPLDRIRFQSRITELGKIYESEIYKYLKRLPEVEYRENQMGEITKSSLPAQKFHDLYSRDFEELCLLEHEYSIPQEFIDEIIGKVETKEDAEEEDTNALRPDIILLSTPDSSERIRYLDENHQIKRIPEGQTPQRKIINVIDIKLSNEENVGKKHFIEILYYMYTLNSFLVTNDLTDKYIIGVEGNGILPNADDTFINSIDQLKEKIVPLPFNDSQRLFEQTVGIIESLREKAPCSIESVELNIQPKCGRCDYLADCRKTLGFENDPRTWDVELLPYTSRSIAEQLKENNLTTIGDVPDGLSNIEFGDTPEPIYTELPLLKIKSEAIVNDEEIFPDEGTIHSVAIPRFSEMNLIINAEADPVFDRVYAVGFYLNMSVPPSSPYSEQFFRWWKLWNDYLDGIYEIEELHEELNMELTMNISQYLTRRFGRALRSVQEMGQLDNNIFEIKLPGDTTKTGKNVTNTYVNIAYTAINTGIKDKNEQNLAKNVVNYLSDVMIITEIIEYHIKAVDPESKNEYGPLLAIFYWSKEIIEAIEELLQRNLRYLILSDEVNSDFSRLIQWFSPSESSPTHPNHYKKVYDLRKFVETTLGFPTIINYTWHEIAKRKYDFSVNTRIWTPNFNYMDFNVFHNYLSAREKDPAKAADRQDQIRNQLLIKLRILNRLRMDFQKESNDLISLNVRPMKDSLIKPIRLPGRYHPLAQLWYMFSKVTDTVDDLEKTEIRTIYPEFSIGRLEAANIDELVELQDPDGSSKLRYRFVLSGMSSNVKIKENDSVLILPFQLRDKNIYERKWSVKIDSIEWDNEANCYLVTTAFGYTKLFDNLEDEDVENPNWYLFPRAFSSWTDKLHNGNKGLLNRKNFGESWLGRRLSTIWDIAPGISAEYPNKLEFNSAEMYMLAPDLINEVSIDNSSNLQTSVDPVPDQSQEEAIHYGLNGLLRIIQGPPGTGKSQTIVAMIDEFLERNKGFQRILVTSFSYPAMEVILEKLANSVDKQGQPTNAANLQKFFVRSGFREPVDLGTDSRQAQVNDLVREGKEKWRLNQSRDGLMTKANGRKIENYIESSVVFFANAHQLYRMRERGDDGEIFLFQNPFYFDLIVIDEASQLPTDYLMSSLQFVKPGTYSLEFDTPIYDTDADLTPEELQSLKIKDVPKDQTQVVIVGDHNQLPPVQPVKPPSKVNQVLGGVFEYLVDEEGLNLPAKQLETNYRSNQRIVEYTSNLGFYENLSAYEVNADSLISGNISNIQDEMLRDIIDPEKVVSTIIHENKFEMAVSKLEASLTVDLIIAFYRFINPEGEEAQTNFWQEELGVVAPHNAQGRLIIRQLFRRLQDEGLNCLAPNKLMTLLSNTIYSVEKFQGSDRSMIIATIGISSKDQLYAEEEFIYDLTRFNVLTSRAKSKVILICSENYLSYIPQDQEVLENASKIRYFAINFCKINDSITYEYEGEDHQLDFNYRTV